VSARRGDEWLVRVAAFPPKPRPSPQTLRAAPELATLAVLEDVVRTTVVALLAVHPGIDTPAEPQEPRTRRRARALMTAADRIYMALDRYSWAVIGDLYDRPDDEEDPPV
jgi:hypothetical protein